MSEAQRRWKYSREFKRDAARVLLTSFVAIASACLAQGNPWTPKANMRYPSYSHGSCAVNGKIYVIGGVTAEDSAGHHTGSGRVEMYDPATDAWSIKKSMPTARLGSPVSAVNGKIYAIGGYPGGGSNSELSIVEEYDPQIDTWNTDKAEMPTARAGLTTCVVAGKIYAIGGWQYSTKTALADVEEYDPQTDNWIKKASMQNSRAWFSTCVVDGKIYALGGADTGGKTVEVYDPVTDIWTSKDDMPNRFGSYFIGTVNGLIYIFGGAHKNGGPPISDSWEYNPNTDTWKSISRLPLGRFAGHASAVNGKIYIIGGSSIFWPFKPTSTVFVYNPRNDPYLSEKTSNFSNNKEPGLKQELRFSSANEQDFRIKARRLIPEKGPSPQNVLCMVQDKNGFIWFGTGYGLLKYDGYTVTVYQHDSDNPNSLSDNLIESIAVSAAGDLWIGTRNGLNRLEPENTKITVFHSEAGNPNSLDHDWIHAVYEDRSGLLWIGTQGGLNQLNPKTGKFIRYEYLRNIGIFAIQEDKSGVLWFGGISGLIQYDRENVQCTHYLPDPRNLGDPNSNFIWSLCADKEGILWVGTRSGLLHLKPDDSGTISFTRDTPKNDNLYNYPDNLIQSAFEDRQGIMWFSTQRGLYRYDRNTDEKPKPVNCQFDLASRGNRIIFLDVFEDTSGILWMATSNGVYNTDKRSLMITSYKHDPDNLNSLSSDRVTAVLEDDKGILWIGTYDGLNRFDRKKNEWTHFFSKTGNPNSLSFNYILSMAKDDSDYLWIGTYDGGLNRFDPEHNQWRRYQKYGKPGLLSYARVYSVYVGRDNTLWAGTWLGILNRYDRQSDTFTWFKNERGKTNTLSKSESIRSILGDRSGMIWIGTEGGGLNRFDRTRNEFTHYQNEPGNSKSLSHNRVNVLYQDRNKMLWIGTPDALNKLDPNEAESKNIGQSFTRYLVGNNINGILEDEAGNLWISSTGPGKGLTVFNPQTESLTDFGYLLGDQAPTLLYKSSRTGEFFIGGDGLHVFHPAEITKNQLKPEVVLTDFQIFNKSVPIADNANKENDTGRNKVYQLEKSITATKEIVLSYKERVFAFEFAALHYADPSKNQYAYKMEGFDRGWNNIGTRRYVSFSNLPAGEYTFRVKASNSDGVWNETGTSLKIIITPPWWKTAWAYALYGLIILSLAYGFWRFQTNRLKMTQQMEMEHFEAEKLREVDHLKSRFFANISHEFRTPITLILGPLQQLIDRAENLRLRDTYLRMERSGNRLLRLINQLLDLSRLEAGKMTLRAAPCDLEKTLRPIVMAFESLAGLREIELCYRAPETPLTLYLDRDKFEKIFTNLLSNAFKFTGEGGCVEVVVDIPLNPPSKGETKPIPPFEGGPGGMLEIRVSDTGSGIPAERLPFIFDRFYQADSSSTRAHEGSGIGLALSKELVELHRGEISVESEEGVETTFTVRLPLGKAHLDPEQISDFTGADVRAKHPLQDIEKHVEEFAGDASPLPYQSPNRQIPEGAGTKSSKGQAPILLIVEDNPDLRAYIGEHLAEGYRIIEAENGVEGFDKAAAEIPDLIVSDVMMPGMDGMTLCEKIKTDQRTSHIPVILLTARADPESKIEGLKTGADDYLTKPFEVRELRVRVKNLIVLRHKLWEKFRQGSTVELRDIALTSIDAQFLGRAMTAIEAHLAEPDFETEAFGREIGLSRSHLNRKLQALTGQSTHEFIRTLRLKRAAQLLQRHAGNVSEIAYQVGFNNLSHFARVFREMFGLTPSEYAARHSEKKL